MTTSVDILAALKSRCGFQQVSVKETLSQLRVEGRVTGATTNINSKNWTIVMDRLLVAEEQGKWSVDLSKHFFRSNGRMLFSWRLVFQGDDIKQHYAGIAKCVASSPSAGHGEVTEIALAGVGSDRNSTSGGRRGAGLVGSTLVGPLALQSKLMGG